MDNKLYYEVKVSLSHEIKEAYEYAVKNNIKYYRCLSRDGKIYGWGNNSYIRATEKQEWFENPNYVAPEILSTEIISEPIEQDKDKAKKVSEQAKKEVSKTNEKLDYKALYEETLKLLNVAKEESDKNRKNYLEVKNELDNIRNAFSLIVKEYELAKNQRSNY